MTDDAPRRLSRHETHDLSMIIKDRTKVLRAHAEEQAAACLADFEAKLAAEYSWDQDETWKAAVEEARRVVEETQGVIAERCAGLGIPKTFAPSVGLSWNVRGENSAKSRRDELRRVATTAIEAMTRAAITKIERQALDLRTQVVAMGLLSADAQRFLETMAPVEEAMALLDFSKIEQRLEQEQQRRLSARGLMVEDGAATADDGFEWAVVEVFGHRRHAGRIREEERFGAKMLRVDVPTEGDPAKAWATHFYGGAAIFSVSLSDMATVMRINAPATPPYRLRAPSTPDPEPEDEIDDDLSASSVAVGWEVDP